MEDAFAAFAAKHVWDVGYTMYLDDGGTIRTQWQLVKWDGEHATVVTIPDENPDRRSWDAVIEHAEATRERLLAQRKGPLPGPRV